MPDGMTKTRTYTRSLTPLMNCQDQDRKSSVGSQGESDMLFKSPTVQTSSSTSLEDALQEGSREKLQVMRSRLEALEAFYSQSCSRPGGLLDKRLLLNGSNEAMAGVSHSAVLWTSTPITAAFTKNLSHVVMLLNAAYFLYCGLESWGVYSKGAVVEYNTYKFTATHLRNGHTPSGAPSIDSFGLLRRGCSTSTPEARFYFQNSSAFLSFPNTGKTLVRVLGGVAESGPPNRMDGAYITTSSASAQLDPVGFTLEGSYDGQRWDTILCASYWRTWEGRVLCRPEVRYPTPTERQTVFVIDMRPQHHWIILNIVLPFWDAMSLMAVSLLASLQRAQQARYLAAWASFMSASIHLAACVTAAATTGHRDLLWSCWLGVISRYSMMIAFALEKLPPLLFADIILLVNLVLEGTYDLGNSAFIVASLFFLWMFALIYLMAHHRWTVNELALLVKPDMEKYRHAWQDVQSDPANIACLRELAQLVESMDKFSDNAIIRQYNRAKNFVPKKQSSKMMAMICNPGSMFAGHDLHHHDLSDEEPGGPPATDASNDRTVNEHPRGLSRLPSEVLSVSSQEENPKLAGDILFRFDLFHSDAPKSPDSPRLVPGTGEGPVLSYKRRLAVNKSKGLRKHLNKSISFGGEDLFSTLGTSSRALFASLTMQDTQLSSCAPSFSKSNSVPAGEWYAPLPTFVPKARERPGIKDLDRPVQSLDQLFTQAVGMDGELRLKVQSLCLESGGSLPVKTHMKGLGYELVRWEDIIKDPQMTENVIWAKLKSQKRAVEKLFRNYKGDVSQLVDVVRQCIVFDNVGQIVKCLRAFAADKDLIVERIKNRLHVNYDDERSAGYRDVLVNFRIHSESTRRLGIELHVCELQLILKSFYVLKTDEGHKRYVTFRNGRGE